MRTRNILFITSSILISGAEKIAIETAIWINKHHNIKISIVPHVSNFDRDYFNYVRNKISILYPFKSKVIDTIVWKINGLTTRLFKWPFREFILKIWLKAFIKKNNVSLVVSHSYPADMFAYTCIKNLHVKHIVVEHGSYSRFITSNNLFSKVSLESADEIVAVSKWSKKIIDDYLKTSRSKVIYNALTPTININSEQESEIVNNIIDKTKSLTTFCMIGRGVEEKGWLNAIETVLTLSSAGYNVCLICIGEGDYLDQLRIRYKQNNNIIFAGRIFNIKPLLKKVNIGLVLPYQSETFGITILDFFEMGIPVIASNIGGIPEVIGTDQNSGGILVEPQNHKEVIKAMETLIDNGEIYSSKSNYASLRFKEFTFEKTALEYYELIKSTY